LKAAGVVGFQFCPLGQRLDELFAKFASLEIRMSRMRWC
jgi:hypothetical protein